MADLLEKDLVYRIVGCAMTVHTELGCGLREKTYERALCIELGEEKLSHSQQHAYPVLYKGQKIDDYIPDLLIENRVIADMKTIDRIDDIERGQMLNYLRVSGCRVGLILNFKQPSLEWERIVLDTARSPR